MQIDPKASAEDIEGFLASCQPLLEQEVVAKTTDSILRPGLTKAIRYSKLHPVPTLKRFALPKLTQEKESHIAPESIIAYTL